MEKSSAKKIKIVCIGDSITEGYNLGPDSSRYYPGALKTFLGPNFEIHNKGVTASCVINTEVNGEIVGLPYIRQPRFSEAIALKSDIYVIMLGTNDASDGLDPVTGNHNPTGFNGNLIIHKKLFAPCYQYIIDEIFRVRPDAEIFLVTPIPIGDCIWPKHQERHLAKLIPIIKKLSKQNELHLIDLHKEFTLLPNQQIINLYQPDGLHPNEVGAQVIGSIIASYISQNSKYIIQ